MPQKCMECFRLLLEHLGWTEHQFLSGIRDSRKAGSLWGMMRGVGGVRKSIHHSWLAMKFFIWPINSGVLTSIYRDNKCTVWCQCGNCTHNYLRGTEDAEDLHKVYPKGVQRRSERKTLSWQQGDGWANLDDLWWKLDLLLWPRDEERESSQWQHAGSPDQEGQTEQIHSQTFDDPFFWQHWHDLHALGFHLTDSQQAILCWGFKGVQEEIPSEEASTLQIGSVAFPPGQCTSSQLHPCHRLFDQDGHQDSSAPSL